MFNFIGAKEGDESNSPPQAASSDAPTDIPVDKEEVSLRRDKQISYFLFLFSYFVK